VTELVLPLHECAAEPLQDAAKSIADPTAAEAAAVESAAEPLHSAVDPTGSGAAQIETLCLCVRV
jgi:hypothetical protein